MANKYWIIKYADQEIEVTTEQKDALMKAWETNPAIALRDGRVLTNKFMHILPSTARHVDQEADFTGIGLPAPEPSEEEKAKIEAERKRVWDKNKKLLEGKYGWTFSKDGHVASTGGKKRGGDTL